MKLFKKLLSIIRNKYHLCKLCDNTGRLLYGNENIKSSFQYEEFYSDHKGKIHIKCPSCEGTGIKFE